MQNWSDCKSLIQDNGNNGNDISILLKDSRDGKIYSVAKLKDGLCWMTQNLEIENITLTSSDTEMSKAELTLPASRLESSTFSSENNSNYEVFIDSTETKYGGFYNWYTATAGTNSSTQSICPKGWRLPSGSDAVTITRAYGNSQVAHNPPSSFTFAGYYTGNTHNACDTCTSHHVTFYWGSDSLRIMIAVPPDTSFYTQNSWMPTYVGAPMRCISKN